MRKVEGMRWRQSSPLLWIVRVLSKSTCWNSNPSVMVLRGRTFGEWLGHDSRALMNGVSFLMKVTPETFLTPLVMWEHRVKTVIHEQALTKHWFYLALILFFLASRPVKNKCLLFKPSIAVCYSSHNRLRYSNDQGTNHHQTGIPLPNS